MVGATAIRVLRSVLRSVNVPSSISLASLIRNWVVHEPAISPHKNFDPSWIDGFRVRRPGGIGHGLDHGGQVRDGHRRSVGRLDEGSSRRVYADAFRFDEHEVTNTEFRRFAEASGDLTKAER